MKIKIKTLDNRCIPTKNGDWYDLHAGEELIYKKNDFKILSLGIAMQLPKGYEALIIPRSSLYKNYGIIQTNSVGLIDNAYCGNDDIWRFPLLAFKNGTIKIGERLCQFRIILNQDASIWQKLRYIFSKPKIVFVKELNNKNRNGFGSTGI